MRYMQGGPERLLAYALLEIRQRFPFSEGASAEKEPGHFEVRKSSSQVRSPGVPDAAKGSRVCPQ